MLVSVGGTEKTGEVVYANLLLIFHILLSLTEKAYDLGDMFYKMQGFGFFDQYEIS